MTDVVQDPASRRSSQDVLFEGWLFKRGNHKRGWNRRYFVLTGDELSYYEQETDPKPKGTYSLSDIDSSCISDIYMHQCKKDKSKVLMYCMRIACSPGKGSKVDPMDVSLHDERSTSPPTPGTPFNSKLSVAALSPISSRDDDERSLPDTFPPELLIEPLSEKKTNDKQLLSASLPPMAKPSRLSKRARSLPIRRSTPRNSNTTPVKGPTSQSNATPRNSTAAPAKGPTSQSNEYTPPQTPAVAESRSSDSMEVSGDAVVKQTDKQLAKQREQQLMHALFLATKKANQKKRKKKIVKGGKIAAAAGAAVAVGVLTAGVGLVAGLAFLGAGAAAGGTGLAAEQANNQLKRKKGKDLVIATYDYEDAKRWKSVLEACIAAESVRDSTWGQIFTLEGRNTTTAMLPTVVGISKSRSMNAQSPTDEQKKNPKFFNESGDDYNQELHWRPIEGGWASLLGIGVHGLRIFREEREIQQFAEKRRFPTLFELESYPCPPLRAQVVLNSSALNAFMCLMSCNRYPPSANYDSPLSGQRASFRLLESIDDHTDVIHLVFRPLFLFPSWTVPRDFVLVRYWRLQDDGTYLVCYDSVNHRACPPRPTHVRAEMHAVYTLAPRKAIRRKSIHDKSTLEAAECMLTAVVQVEPKGWVPTFPIPPLANQGYGEAFGTAALLQILDVRDALDHDRFVSNMHSGTSPMFLATLGRARMLEADRLQDDQELLSSDDEADNYDFSYSEREQKAAPKEMGIVLSPPPCPSEKWAEPDSNSFRVRGKLYKKDKKKINAGSSIGRLVATDVVYCEKENVFSGFCMHPNERMQRALARDRQRMEKGLPSELPPFIFCVNICLPGPPCYHGVFYYAIDDMSMIDGSSGTPDSKLANEFIFGDSDEFRHKTFKLIPQIVQGNFLVRKAVGSTPAIMGTKLRQLYVRGERFFEVILDCGSDPVATGVIRLALGYARTMVIDMGFLLEGNDEKTLPEKIMGCVRIKNLEFGPHLRHMKPPPADATTQLQEI